MRSFIRSHRKTNSLEESPTGFVPPHNNDNEEIKAPEIPKKDSLSFIQSTPPQTASSSFQALKHSPGLESFHRLNKKMFPSKLFKKNSSPHSPLPQPAPIGTKEYNSAPGTPQMGKYEIPGDLNITRNSHENNRSLTVKGTITHSWGDNSDNEQQVIILNNNKGKNMDNRIQRERLQSSTQPSTPLLSPDLGPAVRISSMKKAQESPSKSFHVPDYSSRLSTDDGTLRQDEQQQSDVYNELSRVKNKNRQARIHSHDDVIDMGQNSSVTMDFLRSTFSPSSLDEDPQDLPGNDNQNDIKKTTEKYNSFSPSTSYRSNGITQRPTQVKSEEDTETSQDEDVEEGDTEYLTPGEKEYNDYGEDEEYEEDDDDVTSKFSFELNGINGRTSSVKYYSKAQPSQAMYIDDLYEDENFDEDMHCFEDEEDDELEFPSNRLGIDMSDYPEKDSINMKGLALNLPHRNSQHLEPKPVKKYKDLFALSDEEEENDDIGENEEDKRVTNRPTLAGLGLDHGTTTDFDWSSTSGKKPISSTSASREQTRNMENADRGHLESSSNSRNLEGSPMKDFEPNFTTLHPQSFTIYDSSVPVHSSQTHPTLSINSSDVGSQGPSLATPPEIIRSSNFQLPPSTNISEDLPQPLKNQLQNSSETVIPTAKSTNVTKGKAVKKFSDIFNLDDDLSDKDEDESDLIREINATTNENSSPLGEQITSNLDDSYQKKNPQMFTSPLTKSKTPVQIYLTPPGNNVSSSVNPFENHTPATTPSLPPPARSQNLKYHDLNSNLDSEIPGMMSNLYFIDETEEDKYIEEHKLADEDYLDEINTVPEDFNFSDSENDGSTKHTLRRSLKGSFRSTHSYSSQPTGTAKENTPTRNKLEIKNKTVTFFNHSWDHSGADRYQRSPGVGEQYMDIEDDYINSSTRTQHEKHIPLTPYNSLNKPSPGFMNDKSLSPIQEGSSSVDNSPKVPSVH